MTGLAQYRKLFSFIVVAIIMQLLHRYGITAEIFTQYGLSVSDLGVEVADFLIQYGPTAVAFVAQPNEEGESLWYDWWHWLVFGMAFVALLIGLTVLVL